MPSHGKQPLTADQEYRAGMEDALRFVPTEWQTYGKQNSSGAWLDLRDVGNGSVDQLQGTVWGRDWGRTWDDFRSEFPIV